MPPNRHPGRRPKPVHVIHDRHDTPATGQLLADNTDLARGILIVRPAPGTTAFSNLAFAILTALGKQLPDKPARRITDAGDIWTLACAWVIGYPIDHLVIDRAHTLPRDLRTALGKLAVDADADLWLIDASASHQPATCHDRRHRWLVTGPAGLNALTNHRRPIRQADTYSTVPDIVLPTDGVLDFRAACARRLPEGDFAAVQQVWRDTFIQITGYLAGSFQPRGEDSLDAKLYKKREELSLMLAQALNRSVNSADAHVRLRALQARLLLFGILLHHEPNPFHPVWLGCQLSPAIAAAIERHVSTTAAAMAIARLLYPMPITGYQLRDKAAVPTHFAAGNGSHLAFEHGHLEVPAYARWSLRAHHAFLTLTGETKAYFPDRYTAIEASSQLCNKLQIVTEDAKQLHKFHHGPSIYTRSRSYFHEETTGWMARRRLSAAACTSFIPPHHNQLRLAAW